MSKDFIKFRQYLRTKDLSVNEQFLLEYLFELHNDDYGYAYPSFNDLVTAFNTTSRNRVSNVIKSLENKGLITIERSYKNNRYYIIGIEEFIKTSNKNTNNKKSVKTVAKDSNGDVPLVGQLHVDEIVDSNLECLEQNDVEYLARKLDISLKSALKIYLEANKNVSKVLEVFEYSKTQKVSKLVPYLIKLVKVFKSKCKAPPKELKFRNFTEREYDYVALEKGLLGW